MLERVMYEVLKLNQRKINVKSSPMCDVAGYLSNKI